MATPDFEVRNYGSDFANIRVYPEPPYTAYRVIVKDVAANVIVHDKWYTNIEFTFDDYVSGLDPDTEYMVNVGYNTVSGGGVKDWIRPEGKGDTFITDSGGGGGTTTYSVTLRFNANGGTGAPSSITETSDTDEVLITIPSKKPTRTGYYFEGWSLDDTAVEAEYFAGELTSWWGTESGKTYRLYAVWTKEQTGSVRLGPYFELYTPYIWTSSGWKRATAHIWTSNGWKRGT